MRAYERSRSSWARCPICQHDLNGDGKSLVGDDERGVRYCCAGCGDESLWDFDAPTPILLGGGHITDGRPCWCVPVVEHYDGGDVEIHRDRSEAS